MGLEKRVSTRFRSFSDFRLFLFYWKTKQPSGGWGIGALDSQHHAPGTVSFLARGRVRPGNHGHWTC